MTITGTTPTDIDRLKAAHRVTWASGDYPAVADALVREVAATALDAAGIEPGQEVLDLATGAGNAAIPAASAGARVTGLDLVPELLEQAEARARAAGVEVDWVEGDAEALPFGDDRFDSVVSVVGVQFAPRHEVAAREIARVVRSGGTIALASWTPRGLIGQVFKAMGPYMPKPPEGASPPPLWGDEEHVRALFADTGVELSFESHSTVFEHESPAGFVDWMAEVYGPMLKARELLTPQGTWADLRADLVAVCERANLGAESFLAPSEYLVVKGRA